MSPKEARKEVSDLLGRVDGVQSNVVQGRAGVGTIERVQHQVDLEVEPHTVSVKHELDHVGHLSAGGIWPFLSGDIEPW